MKKTHLFSGCVALRKLPNLSEPPFSQLPNGLASPAFSQGYSKTYKQ